MKRCRAMAFSFAVGLTSIPVSAPGQGVKQIMMHGFGPSSCGLWLEVRANRRNPSDMRFLQAQEWIAGYLSAYNAYVAANGNIAGKTDQEGMYAWLDQYCRGHPIDTLATATEKFIRAQ